MTTDSQQELLTEVDKDNQIIGPIPRGVAHHTGGKNYRTIFILVKNDQDQILIQKRSSSKDLYPNCWDISVGGHVNWGDSYEQTALKELEEELGIKADISELKFLKEVLVTLPSSYEYFHGYVYKLKPSDKLDFSQEEVSSIKWLTIEEILKWMQEKPEDWYARPIQVLKALA